MVCKAPVWGTLFEKMNIKGIFLDYKDEERRCVDESLGK